LQPKINPELKLILDEDKLTCEEFILFNGAIQTEPTRKSYHYGLDCFMEYCNFKSYDMIKLLDTEKLQKLLMKYTISLDNYSKSTINEIDELFDVDPSNSMNPQA